MRDSVKTPVPAQALLWLSLPYFPAGLPLGALLWVVQYQADAVVLTRYSAPVRRPPSAPLPPSSLPTSPCSPHPASALSRPSSHPCAGPHPHNP